MSFDDIRKIKESERREVTNKIASGQPFSEHAQEVSAFNLDVLRKARIIVRADDEDIVLESSKH